MQKLQNIDGVLYIDGGDGNLYRYADVLEYNNPGMSFDPATGEQMAPPPPSAESQAQPTKPREYQFGDVGSQAGNEDLAAAGDIWANAGDVSRRMLPESLQPYVGRSASYLPDMALGGLVGGWGAAQKGIGYGAEVADAGARGIAGLLGIDWPYAAGTGAQKLTNDILGGLEVAGVGPEARALGMASEAAKPALRSAIGTAVERLNQPGPVPSMYSNPIPGLLGDAEPAKVGIKAYQGSPHNFAAERLVKMPDGSTQYIVGAPDVLPDVPAGAKVLQDFPLGRMRMDKIGTGEGNASYGYGLYGAEKEGVAKNYRDVLSQNKKFTPYVSYRAEDLLQSAGGDYKRAASDARANLSVNLDKMDRKSIAEEEEVIRLLDNGSTSWGKIYEMSINADPNHFVNWDKPLSEQHPIVQAVLGSGNDMAATRLKNAYKNEMFGGDLVGKDRATPDEVSRHLADAGIPGIKFLDQGSRSIGAGSHNYVVFDDSLISILRKYGLAGLLTGGAGAAAMQPGQAQASPAAGLLSQGDRR